MTPTSGRCIVGMLVGFAGMACAIEPIPNETGWSGYVSVGASVIDFHNNMVAGVAFVDTGNERIDSLGSPDSQTAVVPNLNMDIQYTFADTRTQLYIGNQLEDMLRLDRATLLGVRQEVGDAGTVAAALQFSGIATRVWKDPYVVGVDRSETDRDTQGMQLSWDRIWGSRIQVDYAYQRIDIEDELSGRTQLGLSAADVDLLDREGAQHRVEVLCPFRIGERQTLTPAVRIARFDLDGDAMSSDVGALQLTHTLRLTRWHLVSNVFAGFADYDERNPVFDKTREDTRLGFNVTGFYPEPMGLKGWNGMLSAGAMEQDSNISFYDSRALALTVGALYRF